MSKYFRKGDFIIYKDSSNKNIKGQIVKFNDNDINVTAIVLNEFGNEVDISFSRIIAFDKEAMNKHKNKCSMQQVLGIIGICLGFIYGIILGCIGLKTGRYNLEDDLGESLCHGSIIAGIFEIIFIVGIFIYLLLL